MTKDKIKRLGMAWSNPEANVKPGNSLSAPWSNKSGVVSPYPEPDHHVRDVE